MKWTKIIVLWAIAVGVIIWLYKWGVHDVSRLGDQFGPNPFRPLYRIAFAWLVGGMIFIVSIFVSKKVLQD